MTRTGRLAAACVLALAAGARAEETPCAAWAVLLYWDADNDLEEAMLTHLEGALSHGGSSEVVVLALVDRHQDPAGTTTPQPGTTERDAGGIPNWHGAKLLRVDAGTFTDLTPGRDDEVEMGEGATLAAFLARARELVSAKRWALVVNDHGAGAEGVCWDWEPPPGYPTPDGHMEMAEVAEALETSGARARPLDVLVFDACLMGTAEVLASTAPYALHVVASESLVPSTGLSLDAVLGDLVAAPSSDGRFLARRFTEVFRDPKGRACDGTRTAGRTSAFLACGVPALVDALGDLADALVAEVGPGQDAGWRWFTRERLACRELRSSGCLSDADNCSSYDLGELTDRLARTGNPRIADAARAVGRGVRQATLCSAHGPDYADLSGVMIHVPCDRSADWNHVLPPAVKAWRWEGFLAAYSACGCPAGAGVALAEVAVNPSGEAAVARSRVTSDLRDLGTAWFAVSHADTGVEVLRLPVEPGPKGELVQVWPGGAFTLRSGDARTFVPVASVRRVAGDPARYVADASVWIDGAPGTVRILFVPGPTGWRTEILHASVVLRRAVPGPDGVRTTRLERLVGLRPGRRIEARVGSEEGARRPDGSLPDEVRGAVVVGPQGLRAGWERLPVGLYRVGFVAKRLDGGEAASFAPFSLR